MVQTRINSIPSNDAVNRCNLPAFMSAMLVSINKQGAGNLYLVKTLSNTTVQLACSQYTFVRLKISLKISLKNDIQADKKCYINIQAYKVNIDRLNYLNSFFHTEVTHTF